MNKVLIKEVSSAWGYDLNTTALALQFFSRTFMQHDAAMQLLRFREPSYNTFELKQDETSIQDGEPEQDEKGNQEGKPEQDKSNANILSLVVR